MNYIKQIFLFFLVFPFLTPIKLGFDSQPWAFVCALLIIFERDNLISSKFPFYFLGFFSTILYGIISIGFTYFNNGEIDLFSSFRSLFAVLSLPICLLAFIKSNFSFIRLAKFLEFSIYCYFIVALIQFFIPSFLISLISRGSTSEERGLYSLTPEPVEYARTCYFILINIILLYSLGSITLKKFKFLSVLLFCQALLFSMAGTAYIWAIIFIILLILNSNLNKIKIVYFVIIFFFATKYFLEWGQNVFPDKRIFNLIKIIQDNPQLLTLEGGFVLRLLNPIHSIYVGIFLNSGLGVGFGFVSLGQYINYDFLGSFFDNVKLEIASRSHGGLVGLVYELGFFSLPFIVAFIRTANILNVTSNQKKWVYAAFFFFLSLTCFDGALSSANVALTLGIFYNFKLNSSLKN